MRARARGLFTLCNKGKGFRACARFKSATGKEHICLRLHPPACTTLVVSNGKIADGVFSRNITSPRELAEGPVSFVNLAVPGNAMSLLRIPLGFASADADKGNRWRSGMPWWARGRASLPDAGQFHLYVARPRRSWMDRSGGMQRRRCSSVVASAFRRCFAWPATLLPAASPSMSALAPRALVPWLVLMSSMPPAPERFSVATDDGSAIYHGVLHGPRR